MGDKKCIIVRHGDYDKVMYGDGPLTQNGRITVSATAIRLREKLKEMKISWVDLAIVSGAIRCQSTYAVIAESFFRGGIMIEEANISQRYFATYEEKKKWKKVLSGKEFHADCERIGEHYATIKYLFNEVNACVDRITGRILTAEGIFQAQRRELKTVLVVTHCGHEALVAEKLTSKPYSSGSDSDYKKLEKGEGRIITFTL